MTRRVLWLLFGIAGITLCVMACVGGFMVLLVMLLSGLSTVVEVLPLAGGMTLGLVLGIPMMLQGWAGWSNRPTRSFSPSHAWLPWAALLLLVGLGAVIAILPAVFSWLLVPIHVAVMVLVPLGVLWVVGWLMRGTGGTWREVVFCAAGGGSVGIGVSVVAEVLVLIAFAAILLVSALVVPGGVEWLEQMEGILQNPTWPQELEEIAPTLFSPGIVLLALVLFSIPVPMIEEVFKTLTGGVVGRWVRPQPARAFLWGVAGGAGFALVENLLNGALSGQESWAVGAISRMAATIMHCATGGLVGWGWGELWRTRRPARLFGCYAVAVFIHGLWNALAVGMSLLGLAVMAHPEDTLWVTGAGLGSGLFILGLMGLVGLLAAGLIAASRFLVGEDQ